MMNRLIIVVLILFMPLRTLADEAAAKVIKVAGTVSAINAANVTRTLARGADVSSKDTITTGVDSSATLRFTDGSVIDVAASSKYIIHDYAFNEAEPKKDKFSSEIVAGGFRAITGTIGVRSPTAFTAKANLTTLSVRGTLFYLICDTTHSTEKSQSCPDVMQFTLEGLTNVSYNGKEYLMGPNAAQSSFLLNQGKVNLSREIPTKLPVKYNGDVWKFKAEVASATPTQKVGAKAKGGGAGNDPCTTLKSVGTAVQ